MPKFVVGLERTTTLTYEIEAESAEDAKQAILDNPYLYESQGHTFEEREQVIWVDEVE